MIRPIRLAILTGLKTRQMMSYRMLSQEKKQRYDTTPCYTTIQHDTYLTECATEKRNNAMVLRLAIQHYKMIHILQNAQPR